MKMRSGLGCFALALLIAGCSSHTTAPGQSETLLLKITPDSGRTMVGSTTLYRVSVPANVLPNRYSVIWQFDTVSIVRVSTVTASYAFADTGLHRISVQLSDSTGMMIGHGTTVLQDTALLLDLQYFQQFSNIAVQFRGAFSYMDDFGGPGEMNFTEPVHWLRRAGRLLGSYSQPGNDSCYIVLTPLGLDSVMVSRDRNYSQVGNQTAHFADFYAYLAASRISSGYFHFDSIKFSQSGASLFSSIDVKASRKSYDGPKSGNGGTWQYDALRNTWQNTTSPPSITISFSK